MPFEELEVYLTRDGLGRAAIVRGNDGFLRIYMHWKWPESVLKMHRFDLSGYSPSWFDDNTPPAVLYGSGDEDKGPEPGLYGTLDDARRQVRSFTQFADSILSG